MLYGRWSLYVFVCVCVEHVHTINFRMVIVCSRAERNEILRKCAAHTEEIPRKTLKSIIFYLDVWQKERTKRNLTERKQLICKATQFYPDSGYEVHLCSVAG